MKKVIVFIIFGIIFILGIIGVCYYKRENTANKITVAEVTHSAFYAPWYVAIEKGYFKEQGIDIEVILTSGADKVGTAVLSGDAQIGLSGLEATIYVYNNGEKDYLTSFSALTKRDGQFLVGDCKYKNDFSVELLKGKSILVGRSGGMPSMVFAYGLYKNNIDNRDVKLDTSVEFAALSGAYIAGQGDFVNLFEPTARSVEASGKGCVLASVGLLSGELPYTVFHAKKSYIENNKDLIQKFVNAINKGLNYVYENDSKTIAKDIINQFPDLSINDLAEVVERYKKSDSWWGNSYIEENAYNNLLELMEYNGALEKKIDFNILVNNEFNR